MYTCTLHGPKISNEHVIQGLYKPKSTFRTCTCATRPRRLVACASFPFLNRTVDHAAFSTTGCSIYDKVTPELQSDQNVLTHYLKALGKLAADNDPG